MNAVLSSRVAAVGLGCCGVGGLFERQRCYLSAALPDGGRSHANSHRLWPSDVVDHYVANPSCNNKILRRGIDTERSHRTIVLPGGEEIGHKVILPLGMKIERRLLRRDAQAVRVLGKYQSDSKLFDGQGDEVELDILLHRYGGVVASERAKKMRMQNKHLTSSSSESELPFRTAHLVHLNEPSGTFEDKKMSFFGVHSLTPPGGGLNSSSKEFSRLSVFVDMEGVGGLDLHLTKVCVLRHMCQVYHTLQHLMPPKFLSLPSFVKRKITHCCRKYWVA